jgi:ATP-dependent Clp protease ATP-binding subunit ClpB
LTWDDKALQLLATQGFDPDFGARPLRRLITRLIETGLSQKIIRGEVPEGSEVKLSADSTGITMQVEAK